MTFLRFIPSFDPFSEPCFIHLFSRRRLLIDKTNRGKTIIVVVFCGPLEDIVNCQWVLVRMMDTKGKNLGATVLARFTSSRVQ